MLSGRSINCLLDMINDASETFKRVGRTHMLKLTSYKKLIYKIHVDFDEFLSSKISYIFVEKCKVNKPILNFAAKSALSKQDWKQNFKKDAKISSLLLSIEYPTFKLNLPFQNGCKYNGNFVCVLCACSRLLKVILFQKRRPLFMCNYFNLFSHF